VLFSHYFQPLKQGEDTGLNLIYHVEVWPGTCSREWGASMKPNVSTVCVYRAHASSVHQGKPRPDNDNLVPWRASVSVDGQKAKVAK